MKTLKNYVGKALGIAGIVGMSLLPLKIFSQNLDTMKLSKGYEVYDIKKKDWQIISRYDNKGRLKEEKEIKTNKEGKINYFGIEKYDKRGRITKDYYKNCEKGDIRGVRIYNYKNKSDGKTKVISKLYEYEDGKVEYFEIDKYIMKGESVVSDYSKTEGYRRVSPHAPFLPVTEKPAVGKMIMEYFMLKLGILKPDKRFNHKIPKTKNHQYSKS